jgi:hypothetical protein
MTTTTVEPVVWSPTPKTQRESVRARFPARPAATDWPATRATRQQAWQQLTSSPFVLANADGQARRVRGLARPLDWLEDQPGQTWQQRWIVGGAEAVGADWRQVPISLRFALSGGPFRAENGGWLSADVVSP